MDEPADSIRPHEGRDIDRYLYANIVDAFAVVVGRELLRLTNSSTLASGSAHNDRSLIDSHRKRKPAGEALDDLRG